MADSWVVVGLDNGGNKNNATVLDAAGEYLVSQLFERPSRVTEGPEVAVQALVESFDDILQRTAIARDRVRAVGLDTPGPASADGVFSSEGPINFGHSGWASFPSSSARASKLLRRRRSIGNSPCSTIVLRARALISAMRTPVGQTMLQTLQPEQ